MTTEPTPEIRRRARFAALSEQKFDVLVIGGGIIGCAVARDAALRGLRVALFEREDFGYGTTSRSTRLIHGGLRYLEMFDFGLVRQDLREREILLHTAPHRVQPLPFLLPFYHRSWLYRAKIRLGMWLYDLLSYDKSLPKHTLFSRKQVLEQEPTLNPEGLQGAARYYDAQIAFPERLCLDLLQDAALFRAVAFNHTEATQLLRDAANRVVGVQMRDRLSGEEASVEGKIVINVAGPWLDRLSERLAPRPSRYLRLTKGIHFAAPSATQNALVLFSRRKDKRLLFVIPWMGYAWVGTTDTDFQENLDTVRATGEEVSYLLDTVRETLPQGDWENIHFTTAGVRALVRDSRPNAKESAVSRKHGLVEHTAEEGLEGVLSVLGGKLTAHRDIAEEAVRRACELLHHAAPCKTKTRSLPGGDFSDRASLERGALAECALLGVDAESAKTLLFLYGTRYPALLERVAEAPELGARICHAYPHIFAQLRHALEDEWTPTLRDFMMRRTTLFFTPDQGILAMETILEEMSAFWGWSPERILEEREAYLKQIALTQAYRQEIQHNGVSS